MKMKLFLALAALALISAGFAVRGAATAARANAAANDIARQRAALIAPMAAAQRRWQAAEAALAKIAQPSSPAAGAAPASVAADCSDRPAPPTIAPRRLAAETLIANDPRKMAEHLAYFRGQLDLQFGGMFKVLGLSAEQIERFKDLKAWVKQRQMDLDAVADTLGLDRDSEGFKALQADHEKLRLAKEGELFGDLTARYREYYRTEVVRELARNLAWIGVYTDAPVTSAQIERATEILAAHSERQAAGSQRDWVARGTVNWDAAKLQLASVLSPDQTETLGRFVRMAAAQAKAVALKDRLTADFKAQTQPR